LPINLFSDPLRVSGFLSDLTFHAIPDLLS